MKDGWQLVKLNEVCNIINGRNQKLVESPDGEYPIYGSGGIMGYATDYLCEAGATIIGRKGSINNPIYVETRFWNVDTAFGLLPKPCMNSRLFHYFCLSFDFTKMNKGTTIPSLVKNDLLQIDVPYNPSISEQQRIVGILDAEFEKIDALKVNAEKNLQNAKDLFQAALKKELEPKDRWNTSTIGKLCTLKSGNSSANDTPDGELPFVKVGDMNITGNEDCITCSSRYVDYEQNRKGIFPIGSIIFPKRGGAILTNKKRITTVEICCDLNIMGVYSNGDITPEFLYYYFQGINLADLYNGAAIPQINNGDIAPLTINYPALDKQKEVVQKLDNLRSNCKTLQDNNTQTIALCDDLKQALLRKAFSGEL